MLRCLPFFWSKILPISYDNYLSETEILEALRRKVCEVINGLNEIGKEVQDLQKNIEGAVENYYITNVLPKLKIDLENLQSQIDSLTEDCNEKYDTLEAYVDIMDNHTLAMLTALEEKHNADIARLEGMITSFEQEYTFIRAYIDKENDLQNLRFIRLINNMYTTIIKWVRKYFNELSNNTITVISPLTAKRVTLQYALEELLQWQARGLTAYQYRRLELTSSEYTALNLTAEEYRLYGISGDYVEPVTRMYDLNGRYAEQPLSSVYENFGDGITADMGGLDITAEQYQQLSNATSAYELDRWGAYILTNQYASVVKDTIYIDTANFTATGSYSHLNMELVPHLDGDIVDYVSLFNMESAEKATLQVIAIPEVDGDTYISGSFSASIAGVTYDSATRRLYVDVIVSNTLQFEDTLNTTYTPPIACRVTGYTTTKNI